MQKDLFYFIIAFPTTTDAMQAEKYTKEYFHITIMPTPREISSGCGLAIRFMEPNEDAIIHFIKTTPFHGRLYKMYTHKVDGHHPIEQLS